MLENKLLQDKDLVDQMVKRGRHSDSYRIRKLHSVIEHIERTCRGDSLHLCRDYKKFGLISESDWDQIVKCHHGHAQKITVSGDVVFELGQYDWHRDSRIHELKFNIPE